MTPATPSVATIKHNYKFLEIRFPQLLTKLKTPTLCFASVSC